MTKSETIHRITDVGIIPVVRASSSAEAIEAAAAIKAGGVPVIEITMTVPGAVEVIRRVAEEHKDVLVGAGTVLDPETARACLLAGADFIVSPALNLETIALCRRYGKAVIPGALTPTEVIAAWQAGADFVKIFPCGDFGGARYLKSLKAPLPQVEMIPTGGVTLQSAAEFIKAGAAALGVGSDLVDVAALKAGRLDIITDNARKFYAIVRDARAS
jgi:2-dehydro-3-deoxyphosphogluconate aldolase/(4S)-4-hydroxy-2-oxoglutarate aldolase